MISVAVTVAVVSPMRSAAFAQPLPRVRAMSCLVDAGRFGELGGRLLGDRERVRIRVVERMTGIGLVAHAAQPRGPRSRPTIA